MTDLPEWVKALKLKSSIQYDVRESGVICLKGSHRMSSHGAWDLGFTLASPGPPGHCLANVKGAVEHKRGDRFTWQVLWIKNEVAERRYQDKQASRLSRFTHNEETT